MLVVSRGIGQSLVVNGEVYFTVIDVRADKVRVGVEAPVHYTVHRREVYEALHAESSPNPTPPVPSPPPPVPPASPAPASLTHGQLQLLERFRREVHDATGTDPGLQGTLDALFRTLGKAERSLAAFLLEGGR